MTDDRMTQAVVAVWMFAVCFTAVAIQVGASFSFRGGLVPCFTHALVNVLNVD